MTLKKSRAAASLGRKGGHARAKSLSPARRSEIAQQGGKANAKRKHQLKMMEHALTTPSLDPVMQRALRDAFPTPTEERR